MLTEFLQQMRPYFGSDEINMLNNYDFSDGFLTEFKETALFEKSMSSILGVKYCHAVNNGTVALTVAGNAVGIKPGDEVLIPNFTMIATPNAFRLLGAKPVFCDIEIPSLCISMSEIRKRITKKTKAVVIVNSNGRFPSYDVDTLRRDLNRENIFLIVDAAQSRGSKYPDGTAIGTKANISTLSFSAPKIISTGQGGLIFTNDEELSTSIKRFKDFGRESGGNDQHDHFGVNFKFTELQAIVGLAQLKKLDERCKRRVVQTIKYRKILKNIDNVSVGDENLSYTIPWFNEIFVDKRDELQAFLKESNIGTRPVYPEINKQKIYNDNFTHQNSQIISRKGLWLPSHMGVSDAHVEIIGNTIKEFYNQ